LEKKMMNKIYAMAAVTLLFGLTTASRADDNEKQITYHGLVTTDVNVAGTVHQFATVRIDLMSKPSKVQHATGTTRYTNSFGQAFIHIDTGDHTYTAHIKPGQIYAVADVPNLLAGFGATSGGYLLFVTQAGGQSGGHTTIAAVADLLAGGDPTNYSSEVSHLGSDLKTATNLTGAAFSCTVEPTSELSQAPPGIGGGPSYPTYGCSTPNAGVTIHTNIGPITLYSPYLDYGDPSALPPVPQPYSLNWGVFWAEITKHSEDDEDD
jgi:hypothetical protein